MLLRLFACTSITVLAYGPTPIHAAYTYANVVDSTAEPGIAANLPFALHGTTVAALTANQVFKVQAGVRTVIAKAGDPAPLGVFPADFLDTSDVDVSNGVVVFRASFTNRSSGVFAGSGGPLTTVAKTGDVTPHGTIGSTLLGRNLSISGSAVGFTAELSAPSFPIIRTAVFRSDANGLAAIAKLGDPAPQGTFPGSAFFDGAALSGSTAAFIADYASPPGRGIFKGSGGAITSVAKFGDIGPDGPLTTFGAPFISGDAVAFMASAGVATRLFVAKQGALTSIVAIGDPAPAGTFSQIAPGGIANDGEDVLYQASWDGGSGIFLSQQGVATSILQRGDLLFGQTLESISLDRQSLDPSGSGNFAFRYRLANGVRGIAIATPVPEPSALALVATSLALIIPRRRARQRDGMMLH